MIKILKKYRSVLALAGFLVFNLLESLYFGGKNGVLFNSKPTTIAEWICDIISNIGIFGSFIMGLYDTTSVPPAKNDHYYVMKIDKDNKVTEIEELKSDETKEN